MHHRIISQYHTCIKQTVVVSYHIIMCSDDITACLHHIASYLKREILTPCQNNTGPQWFMLKSSFKNLTEPEPLNGSV